MEVDAPHRAARQLDKPPFPSPGTPIHSATLTHFRTPRGAGEMRAVIFGAPKRYPLIIGSYPHTFDSVAIGFTEFANYGPAVRRAYQVDSNRQSYSDCSDDRSEVYFPSSGSQANERVAMLVAFAIT